MSHTKELIEEALDKVEKYLEEKHMSEDLEAAMFGANVKRTGINKFFNKLGIHVLRAKEWNIIQQASEQSMSNFGKLSSFQFYQLAVQCPEAFDQSYHLLADQQSKSTFDWYVKYRTAYTFIGERAYELFVPPVTREH